MENNQKFAIIMLTMWISGFAFLIGGFLIGPIETLGTFFGIIGAVNLSFPIYYFFRKPHQGDLDGK